MEAMIYFGVACCITPIVLFFFSIIPDSNGDAIRWHGPEMIPATLFSFLLGLLWPLMIVGIVVAIPLMSVTRLGNYLRDNWKDILAKQFEE